MSLPSYAYQCALKNTDIELKTLQDKDLISLLENIIRGGISSLMGDRYVKSDKNRKIFYADATILYGQSMSQMLPFGEIEMWNGHPDLYRKRVEEILHTPDDSDNGYFVEVVLRCPDKMKEKKTMSFPFAPENKFIPKEKPNDFLNKIKPKKSTKSKKLICDWTDKKKYLIHYRMLKIDVRRGKVVEKVPEFISFKQSKWLENYISFNTQK